MLERIIITLVTHLASYLLTKAMVKINKPEVQIKTENEVDQKLKAIKDAYKEAFNGEAVTKDQRKELNKAIVNFVKPNTSGL